MRSWRWYSKVLFALLVAAFAYWVWPTPWQYLPPPLPKGIDTEYGWGIVALRFNRFTGRIQALSSGGPGFWYPFSMAPAIRLSDGAEAEVARLREDHPKWKARDFFAWQGAHHPDWDAGSAYYAWYPAAVIHSNLDVDSWP